MRTGAVAADPPSDTRACRANGFWRRTETTHVPRPAASPAASSDQAARTMPPWSGRKSPPPTVPGPRSTSPRGRHQTGHAETSASPVACRATGHQAGRRREAAGSPTNATAAAAGPATPSTRVKNLLRRAEEKLSKAARHATAEGVDRLVNLVYRGGFAPHQPRRTSNAVPGTPLPAPPAPRGGTGSPQWRTSGSRMTTISTRMRTAHDGRWRVRHRRIGGPGQVGSGSGGIHGRPRTASRMTRILSNPCLAALDT